MADYPNARDCEHGRLRRSCEQCSDAFLIAALEARLAEVEAERDRAWRECSKAQDESSVWFNKRAAAEGRAAKERSGRLAAEARLAEVEQALRRYGQHDVVCPLNLAHMTAHLTVAFAPTDCTCGLAAVLDKGEQP